jgi:hypothetical protein
LPATIVIDRCGQRAGSPGAACDDATANHAASEAAANLASAPVQRCDGRVVPS